MLALRSFLEEAKEDLRAPPQTLLSSKEPSRGPELFMRLHTGYMLVWQKQHDLGKDLWVSFAATMMLALAVLTMILNMVRFPGLWLVADRKEEATALILHWTHAVKEEIMIE
jgi:hypothetical protein